MLNTFLRGLLFDESGGDMGGDAGGGIGTEVALTSESTALTTTGDQSLATTDAPDETTDDTQAVERFQPVENGRWSKPATKALEPLKTGSPTLYQQIHRDRGIVSRLQSMFPPGVNAFDAIKSYQRIMKELGGEEGISGIRQQLAEMETMDLYYASGDPKLIDQMTSEPEGQAAFVKLVPQGVARLEKLPGGPAAIVNMAPMIDTLHSKLAPNSYRKKLASAIIDDLVRGNVDLHFQRLAQLIPAEDAIGKQSLAAIQKYFDDRTALSQLQPEALPDPVTNPTKDPGREELERDRKRFDQERRASELDSWRSTAEGNIREVFRTALTQHTEKLKLSEGAKETIMLAVNTRMGKAFANVPNYDNLRKSYAEANDRAGYLRWMASLAKEHIPRIVKAEIQKLYPTPGAAATTTTATARPGTPPVRTQPDAGYRRVAKMPDYNTEVDKRQTDIGMWKQKKAVLKTGQRVQWA